MPSCRRKRVTCNKFDSPFSKTINTLIQLVNCERLSLFMNTMESREDEEKKEKKTKKKPKTNQKTFNLCMDTKSLV